MDQRGNKKEGLKNATRSNIRNVGDARKRISQLEQKGIPQQHEDFEMLRDEIHALLDHLILEDMIELEISHTIRNMLSRINELFFEMEKEGISSEELDFDKEKQDSKLHVVQLLLSQIFPKLKEAI